MSRVDYRSVKLNRNHARKLVLEILSRYPGNVRFSSHALKELQADGLTTIDAINVLKSSDAKIIMEGEMKDGSYRYRNETNKICVVVAFASENTFVVVTGWRK